jgi:hypothetical protein
MENTKINIINYDYLITDSCGSARILVEIFETVETRNEIFFIQLKPSVVKSFTCIKGDELTKAIANPFERRKNQYGDQNKAIDEIFYKIFGTKIAFKRIHISH